ncbi:MAG: PIN domain-containing protein [Nitrospirae bacterium]|nr:PIN domain-containing protein [Nitrospirota bacterium]
MQDRILVDTSVWIDFFRGKNSDLTEKIGILLKSGRAVYTGIIALELLNGAKGRKELQVLQDLFSALEKVDVSKTTFLKAGKMGYEIARRGHTLSVVDLLISQIAIENNLFLMTFDSHFNVIAKHNALRLLK